jgi:hypothetical protein
MKINNKKCERMKTKNVKIMKIKKCEHNEK